jgi:hypothetical protein
MLSIFVPNMLLKYALSGEKRGKQFFFCYSNPADTNKIYINMYFFPQNLEFASKLFCERNRIYKKRFPNILATIQKWNVNSIIHF